MSRKFSIISTLARVFSFAPDKAKTTGYCTMSAGAPLPPPVLDTINSIKCGKGWQWKGEYYTPPDDRKGIKEVLMYTPKGGLRVVCIHESGELISIAPKEEMSLYLYQALRLSDYHMNL